MSCDSLYKVSVIKSEVTNNYVGRAIVSHVQSSGLPTVLDDTSPKPTVVKVTTTKEAIITGTNRDEVQFVAMQWLEEHTR